MRKLLDKTQKYVVLWFVFLIVLIFLAKSDISFQTTFTFGINVQPKPVVIWPQKNDTRLRT